MGNSCLPIAPFMPLPVSPLPESTHTSPLLLSCKPWAVIPNGSEGLVLMRLSWKTSLIDSSPAPWAPSPGACKPKPQPCLFLRFL